MISVLRSWVNRYLSDPEAILLVVLLVGGYFILRWFGDILTPIFVSVAIAILLQLWLNFLENRNMPHKFAFWSVYSGFVVFFFGAFLFLLPLLWRQLVNLVSEMPSIVQNSRNALTDFIQSKQTYLSEQYVETIMASMVQDAQNWGKTAVTVSLASIPGVLTWVVYLVLVPLLVFFFLRDYQQIMQWFKQFLPERRGLIRRVWFEMRDQVGNYVRGKIIEIFLMTLSTYLVFLFFDLRYQVLLACLVGLSVVIPYVGIVLVTVPVILVGYFQWGFAGGLTGDFALMLYSYTFVQLLDGAILVPLLFSEAVNLHPIAIIVAILVFGSLWGFWGVFFAIPLATLVKAIINAWPKHHEYRRLPSS